MKGAFCVWILMFFLLISGPTYGQEIKIMSFNIRYDNPAHGKNAWQERKSESHSILCDQNPDILCTQEALVHQVRFLESALDKYHCFGVERNDGDTAGEFAAAYFDTTRFRLLNSGTFWLSSVFEKPSVGWDASLPGICTYGRLFDKHYDTVIFVFNTHYDHLAKRQG
jgi:endonuclease/exonuclease/phosphatase family metal-dependent hydrolase